MKLAFFFRDSISLDKEIKICLSFSYCCGLNFLDTWLKDRIRFMAVEAFLKMSVWIKKDRYEFLDFWFEGLSGLIEFLYLAIVLWDGDFDGAGAVTTAGEEGLEELDGLVKGGLLGGVHLVVIRD